jgi:glutathione S-transferase
LGAAQFVLSPRARRRFQRAIYQYTDELSPPPCMAAMHVSFPPPPRGGGEWRATASPQAIRLAYCRCIGQTGVDGAQIRPNPEQVPMAEATLTISSKNYSSWSLRGWLLCRMAGLDFREEVMPIDDPSTRAELLLLSPSFLVPRLTYDGLKVWDTLAIAGFLDEIKPEAALFPSDRAARAHCRSICGEMHSGFANLRSALPMNLKAHYPGFKVWAGAQADIDRVLAIWRDCFAAHGGPYLFGAALTAADAMYAPVCTRFLTYGVALDAAAAEYCRRIMAWPAMAEWVAAAKQEPEDIVELEVEF